MINRLGQVHHHCFARKKEGSLRSEKRGLASLAKNKRASLEKRGLASLAKKRARFAREIEGSVSWQKRVLASLAKMRAHLAHNKDG